MARLPLTPSLLYGCAGLTLAAPLHLWMHQGLPTAASLGLGFLGGALPPLLFASTWAELPGFLRHPLAGAVALVGVLTALMATVISRGVLYSLLRRDELVAATIAAGLLAVGVASLVETHKRLAAVIARREQELAAERRAAVEAQLRALQAQIRPHFLFNTLNALSELIHEDADAAEDLVTDLAHLLRYSLQSSADGEVPLSDELEAIARYLRIEEARLGERLQVEIDVPDALRGERVPGLILQPLVENAVQHGVATRTEGGRVRIGARRSDGGLELSVEDDGPGLPDAVISGAPGLGTGGHGGGFANVRRRLDLRFGAEASFQAGPGAEGGTRVALVLPAERRER